MAEVYLPEEAGIKQVEDIGVHFHHDGSVMYGSRIDTIMGAPPTESSLDLLTRVLVDLEQDTGFITSNLLTMYQRVMLDSLYCNSSQSRPKYRLIIADSIAAILPSGAAAVPSSSSQGADEEAAGKEPAGGAHPIGVGDAAAAAAAADNDDDDDENHALSATEEANHQSSFTSSGTPHMHELPLDDEMINNAAYKNELRQIVGEIEQMRVFTAGGETDDDFDDDDDDDDDAEPMRTRTSRRRSGRRGGGQPKKKRKLSTLLVIGRAGMLLVGYRGNSDSRSCPVHNEIWRWLSWRGKKQAVEAFIARVYQVGDILGKLRDKLNRFDEDPKSLTKIELLHSESMHELINLEEVLLHLQDSTDINGKTINRRGSVLNLHSTGPPAPTYRGRGGGYGRSSHVGNLGHDDARGQANALGAFTSSGFRRSGGGENGADNANQMAAAAAAAVYNSRTRSATINMNQSSANHNNNHSKNSGHEPVGASRTGDGDSSDDDEEPSDAEIQLIDQIVSFINLKGMIQDVTARIRDLSIALQASRHELESLRQMTRSGDIPDSVSTQLVCV